MSPEPQPGRSGLLRVIALAQLCPAVLAAAGPGPGPALAEVGLWGAGLAAIAAAAVVWFFSQRRQRQTAAHSAHALQQVTSLIEHADCILWEARVTVQPRSWAWDLKFHPTGFSRRFFGNRSPLQQVELWQQFQMPDREAMDRRAREAMEQKQAGYEQEFRAVKDGTTYWMHENVSITPTGENTYWLVGLATDITAKRAAEEARQMSERTVEKILAHADCLLWRATVVLEADGELNWKEFRMPHSNLYPQLFGSDDTASSRLWSLMNVPELPEMNRRSRQALSTGQPGYEQTFVADSRAGRRFWLHERVSIERHREGEWHLVGVVTDITAQREAEQARMKSEKRLSHLLERTDSILWQSQLVRQPDGRMQWSQFFIPPSQLYKRIFAGNPEPSRGFDWHQVGVPEDDEMRLRAEGAIAQSLPGYRQIFHVPRPEGEIWLSENVSIVSPAPGEWDLVGIITDITARRQAELARLESEARLSKLLDVADCMVWDAVVTVLPDGELKWSHYMPRSALHRRIFGDTAELRLMWHRLNVPELEEMNGRAQAAVKSRAPGYAQEFRVVQDTGVIWLREMVTITPQEHGQLRMVGVITDITAQRKAEEAHEQSEGRLRELLTRADCLLWEAEVELTATDWKWDLRIQPSLLSKRLHGSNEPSLEAGLWNQFHIPEWEEMSRRCRSSMEQGRPAYDQIFHIVKPNGEVIWIQENVTLKTIGENTFSVVGVATDITAQRGAEEAVRISAARYRALFQHTPVAILEADFTEAGQWLDNLRSAGVQDLGGWFDADAARVTEGAKLVQITTINETALRMLKAKSPMDFHRRRHLLETPDSRRVIRDALIALWEGRGGLEAEFDMRDVEGGHHRMHMRWWIGRNEAGFDLRQTVIVYIDLTDLKKTEAELAAEKERLAVTLRAMTEGVVTTDVDGKILFINPAAATLTQWAAEEAIGRAVAEICRFANNRTGKHVAVPVARVAQGDVVVNLPPQTHLITRNGSHRIVEGCCAPIHSVASKVMGAVLVFRDVTEHERLEQELVRATRLESVGVLAGGIAHDFNNILTAVMGNLALGILDVPEDSPAGASLRAAEKAAVRARDLTQQLLTFAKGGEPVRAAVQLASIVQEMTTFALHGSQVKPVYELAPKLWPADADKGQIGRVVQNLVINAVQAMPHGGTLRVKAGNERVTGLARPGLTPGDYLLIAISDTGEGIPPENLTRIFDPYFTTKKTGSGLGLAAVYSIIKKHQGHIDVESQVGVGTTFSIWLPALHEKTESTATRPPMAATGMTGRVLFMDDDEIIRDMATKLLRRFGLEVVCAVDGAEMVEKYRAAYGGGDPFSIVVMDLTVPGGMGGLPALAKLKEIDPGVRAIVSSGYSSDPVLANYRAHGFCAVISKPYDIHDFSRVLRDALGS